MSGGVRWSAADDARLLESYDEGRGRAEIAERLGRSVDAIDARRRALGRVARTQPRHWQPGEDRLLRAARAEDIPVSEIAPRLGRSDDAVRLRLRRLGLTRRGGRPYTPSEAARLRSGWHEADATSLARELERSADALRLRARQLGLTATPRRRRWRRDDDARLRAGYADGLTCAEIAARHLPERSTGSIAARAALLGIASGGRRWSADEDHLLAQLGNAGCTIEDAALRLGPSPEAVRCRARKLGPPHAAAEEHRRAKRRWRAFEDDILRQASGADLAVLARRLGRSDHASRRRLAMLGLDDGRRRSPHRAPADAESLTPPQRQLARRAADTGPRVLLGLARRLDRPPAQLRRAAAQATAAGR